MPKIEPYDDLDKRFIKLRKKIEQVYAEAAEEAEEKAQAFAREFKLVDRDMRAQLAAGQITQAQYNQWKQNQILTSKRYAQMKADIEEQMIHAQETASRMTNDEAKALFIVSANHTLYELSMAVKRDIPFTLYDNATVTNLIKNEPQILPNLKTQPGKLMVHVSKQINTAVIQSVVQGESISQLADRITEKIPGFGRKSMLLSARTAMTSAQNSGRLRAMKDSKKKGIDVKKLWIATLDSHTRDAHRDLDGQTQDPDKPFDSILGDIMFPGDPGADPANVWNCRCKLGYEYPKYKINRTRLAVVDEETKKTEVIPYMTYREWERWRETHGEH